MSEYGVDVLAFGAHPDDVELFCGGALLRFAELGHSTGVVDLSRGELATHGAVEERAKEAEAASAILGLSFRENLGLPDGFISSEDRGQLEKVVEVLRRRRPELVLIPWLEERHPDHAAAGALLLRALFLAGLRKFDSPAGGERFVPRQVLHYEMRHRMPASFIMDTSSAVERKRAAIGCYGSQVARKVSDVPTLIGSPLALDAIEARDRYYGGMIGTRAGEPFCAANTLGLVDPLAHFRQNPFPQAHAFEALRR